jgi:hypothetical protein
MIKDFIESGKSVNGVGSFYGDKLAVRISRTIGKHQRRRFERYGEIPSAFFRYLQERGIIEYPGRLNGKSVSDLLDVLWNSLKRDGKTNEGAECLRKHILMAMYPELSPRHLNKRRANRRKA